MKTIIQGLTGFSLKSVTQLTSKLSSKMKALLLPEEKLVDSYDVNKTAKAKQSSFISVWHKS